ncbi:unnamed protein product, partial [Heterosigma akashiwo]
MCLDLGSVNQLTARSHYPIDDVQSCFDALGADTYYFSSCDILAAFWSIPVAKEDTCKLAFTIRSKKFEFLVCPFGLKDSPYSFMMLMNATLGSAKWAHALSFIDDLVIYSKNDWGLHLQHLQDIFTRLTKANLRLKVSKCKFAAGEIKFLGHIVGRQGLRPDPQKVEAVSQLARPDTKKQVRRFLGMTGYYRNMIKDFSTVAGPLHSLTKKIQPDRVKWTPECEKAFISLKKALTSYPVLRLPDMRAPFIL